MKHPDIHPDSLTKNTLKQAFLSSVPVLAGYLVLGLGFGILLRKAGYGVLWAFSMSLLIYGGTMQYVGVGLLAGGVSILTAIFTTITVNARHLFYSISMIGRYKDAGKYKPYLIFALTDETYSILSSGHDPENVDLNRYRFFLSLFNHSYWIIGGILGNLVGAILPFSSAGLEFSMTALFIASFTEQWIVSKDHLPALAGFIGSLLSLLIFGRDNFLIPALLLITLVLTLLRSREDAAGKEDGRNAATGKAEHLHEAMLRDAGEATSQEVQS